MKEEVLRMTQVCYQEQGETRLEDFELSIMAGEIAGLLPINSHGVSALIRLLQYNLPLHYGYIYYREELINSWHTVAPQNNRIGFIQSESRLVDGMTVADNIFVLRPGFKTRIISRPVLKQQLQPVLDELGVNISADAYVEDLTVFQRFVVELVKAVVAGSRLILLRDVSTFISDSELGWLHRILRHYAGRGIAFLYIGFHHEELYEICDRVAFFVSGRIVKVLRPEDGLHLPEQYCRMVRTVLDHPRSREEQSPPVLELEGVCGGVVRELSFSVALGECVVLQDLQNQMIAELVSMLSGALPLAKGRILLCGAPLRPGKDRRVAVIQERPAQTMLYPEMTYLDNLCLTMDHRLPAVWRSRRMQAGLKQEYGQQLGRALFERRVDQLSKWEKYDLIYERVALQNPKVVFCVQPFKEADLALRMHILERLEQLLRKKIAVVILAVNLADSLAISDRLIRLHRDDRNQIYHREEFGRLPLSAPWALSGDAGTEGAQTGDW